MEDPSFDMVYEEAKAASVPDALEKRGMTMEDLAQTAGKYEQAQDPEIMQLLFKLMSPPEDTAAPSASSKKLTKQDVLEVTKLQHEELVAFQKMFKELPNAKSYDSKSVMLAMQIHLDAKASKK